MDGLKLDVHSAFLKGTEYYDEYVEYSECFMNKCVLKVCFKKRYWTSDAYEAISMFSSEYPFVIFI